MHFFIIINFETVVRGASGHPTGSMISCIVRCLKLLSQNTLKAKVHYFITTNFEAIVRGAKVHPTGSMISCIVPCPMN